MRLDVYLVKSGLAQSRTQAQDFIAGGFVFLEKEKMKIPLSKPGYVVDTENQKFIQVDRNPLQKYVSRAGLKLEGALNRLNLDITKKTVLDIGQSTGGFTDCLLQRGAAFVVGVDVGHGQLNSKLRTDTRVRVFEDLNAKDLSGSKDFLSSVPAGGFDFIVADLSFISLSKVVPFISEFLKKDSAYLFLVKPQFEAGPENLDKNGIVTDPGIHRQVEDRMRALMRENFNDVQDYFKSEVSGKDGNQEYFIYGKNSK